MHCGDQYPDKPPTIQFINEVNLPCVNPKNGVVSIPIYVYYMTQNPGLYAGSGPKRAKMFAGRPKQASMPCQLEPGQHNGDSLDRIEKVRSSQEISRPIKCSP